MDVLEWVLRALDSRVHVCANGVGRCMRLYVGPALFLSDVTSPIFDLELTRFGTFPLLLVSLLRGHAKGALASSYRGLVTW